jgi:AraC-like DNA-binding protein
MNIEYFKDLDKNNIDFFIHNVDLNDINTEVHSHTKAQLLYAEGGIVHVFINEKHWYLPARCYMWIPANTKHAILTHSKSGELYNIYFNTEENEKEFYSKTNIYYADDLLREMFLYTKKWEGEIEKNNPVRYDFLRAIKSILPEMESSLLPINIQHPFPKDPKLFEISKFLLENIDKSYTIEEIAKIFGISARTLSRKFKENLGMNYVRFLRSIRITRSLEMIVENKYNMYEIAMLVGYNSLSSFSTIFLKVCGIRPTDYAKKIHQKKDN